MRDSFYDDFGFTAPCDLIDKTPVAFAMLNSLLCVVLKETKSEEAPSVVFSAPRIGFTPDF